jgi:hypothetical protein
MTAKCKCGAMLTPQEIACYGGKICEDCWSRSANNRGEIFWRGLESIGDSKEISNQNPRPSAAPFKGERRQK